MLEAIDFTLAYFLFCLSVFGVAIIDSGRATVDRTREADAINNAPLSDANSSPFLNNRFV